MLYRIQDEVLNLTHVVSMVAAEKGGKGRLYVNTVSSSGCEQFDFATKEEAQAALDGAVEAWRRARRCSRWRGFGHRRRGPARIRRPIAETPCPWTCFVVAVALACAAAGLAWAVAAWSP